MAPKQKMRLANEKHSKNVTNRGNVPKSLVSHMLSNDDIHTAGRVYIFVCLLHTAGHEYTKGSSLKSSPARARKIALDITVLSLRMNFTTLFLSIGI